MAATKFPPRLTLEEAIRVIKGMHQDHQSREVSLDLMPDILKTKKSSSFFVDKISALQKFGFVEKKPNDLLWLTDLSMQIVDPIGNEADLAIVEAFKRIELLADLSQKYPNGKLPSQEQLQQSLLKVYQVPRETIRQWYDFIVSSFRMLPNKSFRDSEKQLLQRTSSADDSFGKISQQDYKFTVPLEDGSAIQVAIPQSAKPRDLKRVKAMIDALMSEEAGNE